MSYYEDELAPPTGDFTDTLIRAASLSALLLTACSDPKPAAPHAKVATELVRPAEAVPGFTFAPAPGVGVARASANAIIARPKKPTHAKAPLKSNSVRAAVSLALAASAVKPAALRPDHQHVDAVRDVEVEVESAALQNESLSPSNPPATSNTIEQTLAPPAIPAETPVSALGASVESTKFAASAPAEIPATALDPTDPASVSSADNGQTETPAVMEVEAGNWPTPIEMASSLVVLQPTAPVVETPTTLATERLATEPSLDVDVSENMHVVDADAAVTFPILVDVLNNVPSAQPIADATPTETVVPLLDTSPVNVNADAASAEVPTSAPPHDETMAPATQLPTETPEPTASETHVPNIHVAPDGQANAEHMPESAVTESPASDAHAPPAQPIGTLDPVSAVHKERSANQSAKLPVRRKHDVTEALPPIPNRHIVQALAATFTAVGWYDANQQPKNTVPSEQRSTFAPNAISSPAPTTQPDVEPETDTETEAEWEARMQTSSAPVFKEKTVPGTPKNLSSETFAQNAVSDKTNNTFTLNLAALGDTPINGFFITESIGNGHPNPPAANDPNWQPVESADAYGAEHGYVLKESYADSTPVKLTLWFKDSTGLISAPVQSIVTAQQAVTELAVVTADNVYSVDTANGFKDWNYRRGANQMGSASQGRAKARADADNFLLGPPIKLPTLQDKAELLLQLTQWYQYDADVSIYDGARATVEIATEQAPGVWSGWKTIKDPDPSTSIIWTTPRFDLSAYAGATIKLRIGIAGNLRSLSDWGLSDLSIAVEAPIQIRPHSSYAEGFEAGWNRWSSRLAQWSITGPGLDGKVLAPEGLHHASAAPLGAETGNFALNSPIFELPESPVELSFSEWHNFKFGEGKLQIAFFDKVTGWREWRDLGRAITGRSDNWKTVRADLTPYAGLRVRVRLLAHLTPNDKAWRIDEFLIASP